MADKVQMLHVPYYIGMDIELQPGSYVLAVSGGVDSMALMHALRQQPGLRLVVAHFDHGIRADSDQDRLLVQQTAHGHGLPFVYNRGFLGAGASEAMARKARYDFLRQVQLASGARAIITAHHQDDLLETAILNMLRGTGRKGLSALAGRPGLERPLLKIPKIDIINYARSNGLNWREDSTNQDQTYLRNYIRHRLLPRFSIGDRQRLLELVAKQAEINAELDHLLINQLHSQPAAGRLDRDYFVQLPHNVAREVMAGWLRARGIREFDRRMLERLVVAAKTGRPGSRADVMQGVVLMIGENDLALRRLER